MPTPSDETILDWLAQRARQMPDDVFCTYRGEEFHCADLERQVLQMAARLAAEGIRGGDRVALMAATDPLHVVALLALARLGAVRVPVNIHLCGAPLTHLLAQLRPLWLVADPEHREVLEAAGPLPRLLWRQTLSATVAVTATFRLLYGLAVLRSPFASPKANAICERVVGTMRRECLDWMIPLSKLMVDSLPARGLLQGVQDYVGLIVRTSAKHEAIGHAQDIVRVVRVDSA